MFNPYSRNARARALVGAGVVFAIGTSPTALAAQRSVARQEIGKTSVGTPTPVFLETRSVSREGAVVTATIRVALVPPLKHPKGDLKSSRTIGMYNCAQKTVATKESWYYLDDAGKREGMHRVVKIPGFGPVGKGSVADVALTHLCAKTP
ncbi:surface-adhesin E family protein [Gemmatimonas sp.]|uniref:surface-adhesin E family protein n=1 Tax=Gemmatimonas sp. TaxID=1962908 RepID=UPI003DA4B3CE